MFHERPTFWFFRTTALATFALMRLRPVQRGRLSAPAKAVSGGARLALM
jgi:hypothetical protein